MKTIAIHQPQYLPYLGFFHKLHHADLFVAMDTVQFQRRGVQHRNRIKTPRGAQWLTVPVLRAPVPRESDGRSEQATRDVMIDTSDDWRRRQANAIRLNYARSAFFEPYWDGLHDLLDRPWTRLFELDMATIEWAMSALGIGTPITYLSELDVGGTGSELLLEVCRAVGADRYLSGPGGKQYMDLSRFDAAGVEIVWQDFESPRYPQQFPDAGFVPDLSVIDALFCCGPDVKSFVE